MSIFLGSTNIGAKKLGTTDINLAYLGDTAIFGTAPLPNALLDGLVSYYKADTNGSFPDAHGSNTGTINGATYTASGKLNGAYSFDGTNDYVDITGVSTGTSFTVSAWLYRTGNIDDYNYLMDSQTGRVILSVRRNTASGGDNMEYYDGTWHSLSYTMPQTTWTFVTYSVSGTSLNFYVNGVKQGSTHTVTAKSLGGDIMLGTNYTHTTSWADGIIDEVGFWNRALSATDVANLYNSNDGLPYSQFTL